MDSQQIKRSLQMGGLKYGGFWRRVIASFIDILLLQIVLALLFGYENTIFREDYVFIDWTMESGNILVSLLYFTLMESSRLQATFGKMIMGMKVINMQGNRISLLRALVRYLAKILSALILFIGFLMVAITGRKQGLHDILAGTLIVKRR